LNQMTGNRRYSRWNRLAEVVLDKSVFAVRWRTHNNIAESYILLFLSVLLPKPTMSR
jgi:hypothetical protein